jgi:Ion channel
MIVKLLIASCLVAITVTIHAVGLGTMLSHAFRSKDQLETRFWPITWLLIRIAWLLIVIHLFEIAIWALFFWWQKCLPDVESSFYFSGVTYATIGYGDIVLPQEWRLFGPVEGLTGILMCGLSTAFFFVIVSKKILERMDAKGPSLTS